MKILFLSTRFPYPPDCGHYLRTYNTLKHLARNHEIFFISFAKRKIEPENLAVLKELCATVDVYYLPEDINRYRLYVSLFLNLFSPLPFIAQKYFSHSMKERIKNILSENRVEIMHVDMLPLARYIEDINKPKVLVEHNVESLRVKRWVLIEKNWLVKLYMYLQYNKLYRFEKRVLKYFDKIIAVSDFDKNELEKMYPEGNFITIPNGVDKEYFKVSGNHRPKNEKELIWVGGFGEVYNRESVEYFLERIFPLILKQEPETRFKIIGASPSKKMLDAAQKNHNIEVLGFVDDIRPHIEQATVYVAPIQSGSGTKLKILNALAMEIPVVTTTIGAEGIDLESGKNIVIEDDAKKFSAAIIELLRNKDKRLQIAREGRLLVETKYEWNVIGDMMHQVYNQFAIECFSQRMYE